MVWERMRFEPIMRFYALTVSVGIRSAADFTTYIISTCDTQHFRSPSSFAEGTSWMGGDRSTGHESGRNVV
jgi:hypothetical protein